MMPIFSKLSQTARDFYIFSGLHSFLIGLFPFFLPVLLWKNGFSLQAILSFIALTGLGFCVFLWIWDRVHKKTDLNRLIAYSFLLELLLLTSFFISNQQILLFLSGLLNGAYSCFFWITQRVLFFETISTSDTGRKFANFQIFVFLVLKIGIICGGILLEKFHFSAVYLVSVVVIVLGSLLFMGEEHKSKLPQLLLESPPLNISTIINFNDRFHSRSVFYIDGLFLYLESYIWAISLFLIVKESFWHLALLVIILSLFFSLIFFFIKNRIDCADRQKTYTTALFLYMLSWFLRGFVSEKLAMPLLISMLISITFFTTFFRLAFNKRFFDYAKQTTAHQYIFLKSYYSQFSIAVCFSIISILIPETVMTEHVLKLFYWSAGIFSLYYLRYA